MKNGEGEWNKADLQLDFLFDEILRNHEDWLCGEIIKDPMAYLNSKLNRHEEAISGDLPKKYS